ncbi:hypothetical protein [Pedobacter nyackensis]|uniref:Uncharacterized protein n=1 Tax=Pedobacter nyackensis TaxID=475255 RepID=A0A1W2EGN0_9SPHI|nr:hypothetical protein [Pedobacter nyackensis]SMD08859.1 hypothetical protein SAMN04488101_11271 [Pedobacter nyackensis]
MIDPKEKDEKQNPDEKIKEEQPTNTKNTNWHEHQQIDEEGNEIKPEDI